MGLKRKNGCFCCKLAYEGRAKALDGQPMIDIEGGETMEMGLHELVHYIQQQEEHPTRLEPAVARQVAGFAKARAREAMRAGRHVGETRPNQDEKIEEGGQQKLHEDVESPLAPFDLEEIHVGPLLGIGGFSTVYEIRGFSPMMAHPTRESVGSGRSLISSGSFRKGERPYSKRQKVARDFLTQHALREGPGCKNEADHGPIHHADVDENDEVDTGTPTARYALKHLRPGLLDTPEKFAKAAMDLSCEAEMMRILDHPHIVKLRGCGAGGPGAYKYGYHNSFFLIIDRLVEILEDRIWIWRSQWKKEHQQTACKDIVRWAKKRLCCVKSDSGKRLTKETLETDAEKPIDSLLVERLKIAYDISTALEYLHERRIIYRDLKSSNIGFDFRGDVRLFDFGLSRFLPSSTENLEDAFRMSNVGTRRYTAPEVEAKNPYNLKADVFSFGVVIWEMMTLSSPRALKRSFKDQRGSKDYKACACWPTDLQHLIRDMLSAEPENRPPMKIVRGSLKDLLVSISDNQTSSELLEETDVPRRRSTFKLEAINLNFDEFKRLAGDSERMDLSHTSVDTSFTSYN